MLTAVIVSAATPTYSVFPDLLGATEDSTPALSNLGGSGMTVREYRRKAPFAQVSVVTLASRKVFFGPTAQTLSV